MGNGVYVMQEKEVRCCGERFFRVFLGSFAFLIFSGQETKMTWTLVLALRGRSVAWTENMSRFKSEISFVKFLWRT